MHEQHSRTYYSRATARNRWTSRSQDAKGARTTPPWTSRKNKTGVARLTMRYDDSAPQEGEIQPDSIARGYIVPGRESPEGQSEVTRRLLAHSPGRTRTRPQKGPVRTGSRSQARRHQRPYKKDAERRDDEREKHERTQGTLHRKGITA